MVQHIACGNRRLHSGCFLAGKKCEKNSCSVPSHCPEEDEKQEPTAELVAAKEIGRHFHMDKEQRTAMEGLFSVDNMFSFYLQTGKSLGMDVTPHTNRKAQAV